MSVTFRKAGTCRWSQKYDNIWGFSVRKCKYHRWLPCWQACGAQLTNPNAHQERPPEPSQYWYFPQMCYQYITSLGSIVQKGKFSAAAWLLLVNTLKKVDWGKLMVQHKKIIIHIVTGFIWEYLTFEMGIKYCTRTLPTLGSPTMPTFRFVPIRPMRTVFSTWRKSGMLEIGQM